MEQEQLRIISLFKAPFPMNLFLPPFLLSFIIPQIPMTDYQPLSGPSELTASLVEVQLYIYFLILCVLSA